MSYHELLCHSLGGKCSQRHRGQGRVPPHPGVSSGTLELNKRKMENTGIGFSIYSGVCVPGLPSLCSMRWVTASLAKAVRNKCTQRNSEPPHGSAPCHSGRKQGRRWLNKPESQNLPEFCKTCQELDLKKRMEELRCSLPARAFGWLQTRS